MNSDILGREIKAGDFVVYTSSQIGLRIGLVLNPNMENSIGAPYPKKRCSVLALDYRDRQTVLKSTSTPDTNRIIICDCIPPEYKDILTNAAKEKYDA